MKVSGVFKLVICSKELYLKEFCRDNFLIIEIIFVGKSQDQSWFYCLPGQRLSNIAKKSESSK